MFVPSCFKGRRYAATRLTPSPFSYDSTGWRWWCYGVYIFYICFSCHSLLLRVSRIPSITDPACYLCLGAFSVDGTLGRNGGSTSSSSQTTVDVGFRRVFHESCPYHHLPEVPLTSLCRKLAFRSNSFCRDNVQIGGSILSSSRPHQKWISKGVYDTSVSTDSH